MIAGAAALAATALPAQAQFASITGFGDSYADTGGAPGGAFRLANRPCIYAPYCSFTGGTTFVQSLQSIYGLPGMTNYAIGGARTDNTNTLVALPTIAGDPSSIAPINPPLGGFPYELWQLAVNGTRFTARDLIVLSIGGNDESYMTGADSIATVNARAILAAQNAVFGGIAVDGFVTGGAQQLVAAGARNIAWLGTGNSKWFPEPPNGTALSTTQRDAWANTYLEQTQLMLRPLALAGVRIFMFDFGVLQERVANNPGMYGFTSATNCEAGSGTPGVTPGSVVVNKVGCFYQNSVHPTAAAMALIATYMANQIDAPTTVVPQGRITTSVASGFATSVFGRLDAYRTFQPYGIGSAMAMAHAPTKAMPIKGPVPIAPGSRWSMFSEVGYSGGTQDRQFYAAGYDLHAVGGTLGVEYRLDPTVRLGAVFGYSEPHVDLSVQNARNNINAYQFAGYASYTDMNWFADGLLAYGRQDFALVRNGVIDTVHGGTSADTFTAAAKGGWLTDVGLFRAGPIASLAYTHANIHAYTETGDSLLTMMVDRQALDNLTGGAGLQVRLPVLLSTGVYNPFVNVTAEHDFLGSGRVVTTTQVTAPLLPVLTPVPDASGRTYGKVAGGVAAIVAGNVSATVNAATTFGREGGNDFGVSGGIRVAF
ncbi:MAG: autotransporter domain-containing protein [Rhodoplanes sp.]|nr:autotransporter domain-containing protein [Rhodoplanes sp.]